jgi:predicted RNase H-like nuclease (RuvC/YqgF family)
MEIDQREVSGREAFRAFEEGETKHGAGGESFEQRVARVKRELEELRKETEESEDKDEDLLRSVSELRGKAELLVDEKKAAVFKRAFSSLRNKDLSQLLNEIGEAKQSEDGLSFQLKWNSKAKNLLISAKISGIQKRVNVI